MCSPQIPSGKNRSYAAAFVSYRRVRRLIGWSLGGWLSATLLVTLVVLLGGARNGQPWVNLVLCIAAGVMFASIIVLFGAIFVLRFLWMCPRCGEAFGVTGWFSQDSPSCQHCGLVMRDAVPASPATRDESPTPLLQMLRWRFRWNLTFGRIALATAISAPFLLISAAGAAHAVMILCAHRAVAHWDEVNGQLTAVEFRPGEDPQVEYTYRVRGIEYQGRVFSPVRCHTSDYWAREETSRLKAAVGRPGGIPVYYSPADPARSCIYRENSPAWTELIVAGGVAIVAVVLFVLTLLDLPKSENSEGGA